MGLFDFLSGRGSEREPSWEEQNAYTGETPDCPKCGTPLTKRYVFSGMYCENCHYGLDEDADEDDNHGELLSVDDAALIWQSKGCDEDYTFGYTEDELRRALD
jgi:ribosomal protein L37AE/L43A